MSGGDNNRMLAFVMDRKWWWRTFLCAWRFAPSCLLPALVLAAGNCLLIAGQVYFYGQLNAAGDELSQIDLPALFMAAGICLVFTVVGLLLAVWATFIWLLRITAFARAYRLHGAEAQPPVFLTAMAETAGKAGYIFKFWLLGGVYLCLPLVPLCLLIALNILTRGDIIANSNELVPLPDWLDGATSTWLLIALGTPLTMFIEAYTLVGVVFSAVLDRHPFADARQALRFCLSSPLRVLTLSLVVLIFNALVTTPFSLLAPFAGQGELERNLFFAGAVQLWLALSSVVVWPMSAAAFCMIVPASVGCEVD